MAVNMQWMIPGRILLVRFAALSTVEEYVDAALRVHQMMGDSAAVGRSYIHIIADLEAIEDFPRPITGLTEAIQRTVTPHPNTGWILPISSQPFVRFVASLTVQTLIKYPRYHMVRSVEAAIEFLRGRDPNLATLPTALLVEEALQIERAN